MAKTRRSLHLLALLGVIWLAFALRIHDLDGQSMWSDEGLSLYRARQPLAQVFQNIITVDGIDTQDTNPPFYFLLLHLWRGAAGESVFALRFAGAALATLSVPLIYGLGTAVYRRRVGLATAVLLALSPFHIWQSQLLRNYGLLLSLNLLAVYALFRFLLDPAAVRRGRWLFLWAAASALGVYTHYFGFFVLAFGLACLAIFTLQSNRALWRSRWLWLGLGATLLLILPIIPIALARFQAGQQIDFYHTPLGDFLYHALNVFSAGIAREVIHSWWRVLPVALLALLGLGIGWRINRRGTWLVAAYQVIPLGLLILLSLLNPLYNGARHLLIGLPPFLLLCAAGMVGGWERGAAGRGLRWGGLALGLLTIGLQANWLSHQFTDPDLRIDDVRGAATYLSAVAAPEDRIILHDTLIGFTFDYYYEGDAPWQAMPLYGQQRVDRVAEQFAAAGEETAGRVWFLSNPTPRTGFPTDRLPAQADGDWTLLEHRVFPSLWLGVALSAYLPDPAYAELPEGATATTAVFPHLQLSGHQLPANATAGTAPWISLYWSALPPETGDHTVSLRLLDDSGTPWQQSDLRLWNQPPNGRYPADAPLLRADYPLSLPAGLPPGDYTLWLRLLDADNQPIADANGQIDTRLGQIAIESGSDPAALPPHTPQTARRGEVTLLGYRLPDAALRPGHLAPLDLFWQVRQTPKNGLLVRAELLSPAGQPIATAEAPLARADHPPTDWQPGEILQSKLNLLIPATAVPEPHTVRLTLLDENGRSLGRPISLNQPLAVAAWPLVTELPPLSQPIGALFGDPAEIRLAGVEMPETAVRPGETLPLTLVWQAIDAPTVNYAVFVHLLNEAGEIVAQRDGLSVNGFRPSASWRPDEVILDPHDLTIPADLPPGTYRLLVGLYEPESWQRPLLTLNGQPLPDNQIPLAQIIIEATE